MKPCESQVPGKEVCQQEKEKQGSEQAAVLRRSAEAISCGKPMAMQRTCCPSHVFPLQFACTYSTQMICQARLPLHR